MSRFLNMALLLVLVGCVAHRNDCETLCRRMVDPIEEGGCGLRAWKTQVQCVQGCVDDLYRRDDADTILACYWGALDGVSREKAEVAVDAAVEEGLIGAELRGDTVDEVMGRRCDLFEIVQCKTEATRTHWDPPLLPAR